ncbi:SCO family protein [Bradyrhizobium sp. WSM 1704]|uniref:SCO family protein n=1 Tax=Bradyrhizobium semiaridum TaxID=2821404 RepID=UPI001CE37BE8|nr:SCO family protein [Bradyrhizobium semiaridum]MCA6124422.1 SCO family protein [Bradyrhizobium semiaridum]
MMQLPTEIAGVLAIVAMFVAPARPATAGVAAAQVRTVEAAPAPNAALPLDLGLLNESGEAMTLGKAIGGLPAIVIFVDYTCRTLCGPVLEFAADGLGKTGLKPGVDYRLIVIGIDPRDGIAAARTMRAQHIDDASPILKAATFLTGHDPEIHAVTAAAGLHYTYDAEHDQFAHPAAVYVVDSGGHVRRVLSPLGLDGTNLRLAIVDAGRGAVGTLTDRIHLLCYGYDPVKGIYTERITTLMSIAAGLTLVTMAGGISLMVAREKRNVRS